MSSDPLVPALRRIAQALSGALELGQVLERVAEAVATVLPFDYLMVARSEGEERLTLHAFTGPALQLPRSSLLSDCSPAIRPLLGGARRYEDLPAVLDRSFSIDRQLSDQDLRSGMIVPLLHAGSTIGFLGIGTRERTTFTDAHETALGAIADLIVLALRHEQLQHQASAERRRLETLDSLLLTMADAIDVREIFDRISAVVRSVLPHDRMILATLSEDSSRITLEAVSGEPIAGVPTTIQAALRYFRPDLEYEIVPDLEQTPLLEPGLERARAALGLRSLLRIPMRLEGARVGALIFLSRTPAGYQVEDVPVARRVADHLSLALSHQRLYAEERHAAAERERAVRLEERVQSLRAELDETLGPGRAVGESARWKEVLDQAAKVAATETTVLLTGESGTGKEVVARLIHRGSPRAEGPFVAINCAAIPENLLESELFGHEKGAFTGATAARAGRIDQARGGVLFLDEVGEMSLAVQAKLLRVLQDREYQALGSTRPLRADVRVIAATNRDLESAIRGGSFREDLYYRLRVFDIHIPPLRERREDIVPLIAAFLDDIGRTIGRPAAGISRDAYDALLAYRWPGNARELRNALERATILCEGGLITAEHLPIGVRRTAGEARGTARGAAAAPGTMDLAATERDTIVRALRAAGDNRSQAARLLGITRSQLYSRMQKYGLGPHAAPDPRERG